jgi:predicted nucleic acid-binding Zn ribbon protein
MPCETPGCSERCSYAYSCHEQRMGRVRFLAWPIVALAILVVIGISL